jgi:hypothetical protein
MLQIKKNTRLALKIDLALQFIPLLVVIVSLIGSIFEKMVLILTLIGLAVLGIVQMISVFCFIGWLNDMVRVKYLVACLIYGILFIISNFVLESDAWPIITAALSIPMAIFYFCYSWKFYKINKDIL